MKAITRSGGLYMMRALVVVAMLGVVVAGTPACAEEMASEGAQRPGRTVEVYHSAGEEFGMALGASLLSVLYTPVRLVYGVVGAGLGGVQGWVTGGNRRAADGMWRVTTEGDYYVRPDHFDGSERFDFTNVGPVVHDRYVTTDSDL
jgi:hypothetical protein